MHAVFSMCRARVCNHSSTSHNRRLRSTAFRGCRVDSYSDYSAHISHTGCSSSTNLERVDACKLTATTIYAGEACNGGGAHPQQHNELGVGPHCLDSGGGHGVEHVVWCSVKEGVVGTLWAVVKLPAARGEARNVVHLGCFLQRPAVEKVYLFRPWPSSLSAHHHRHHQQQLSIRLTVAWCIRRRC